MPILFSQNRRGERMEDTKKGLDRKKIFQRVKFNVGIDKDDTTLDESLKEIIEQVTDRFYSLKYPFDFDIDDEDVPKRFNSWIVQASVSVFDSIGYANVRSYSENGVSISWQTMNDGISASLINDLIPKAGVVK